MQILCIVQDGEILAKGVYLPEAIISLIDNGKYTKSYSDMGVFILLKGSKVIANVSALSDFICNNVTSKDLIFQSRNSAAKFVLGEKGHTNDWK